MRVLVAEHDSLIAREISLALTAAGFMVDQTDVGDDALEMVRQFDYDVVLLDAELSHISGVTVLQQMRNYRRGAPVIILTAGPTPRLTTLAFGAGADDVLATPVNPEDLVARVHALARCARGLSNAVIRIGALAIDLGSQQVTCHGEPFKLTGKEFAIFELLVLRKGTVLTRDAFMNHLYGGMDEPELKIIDVFICKLRKKLQLAGIQDLIINVWGRGYMLREGRSVPETTSSLDMPTPVQSPECAS
jgi:two-component system cell cycle response regulator CtrA